MLLKTTRMTLMALAVTSLGLAVQAEARTNGVDGVRNAQSLNSAKSTKVSKKKAVKTKSAKQAKTSAVKPRKVRAVTASGRESFWPAPRSAMSRGKKSTKTSHAPARSHKIVSEARRYLGTNPTSRKSLWCARFMNMVLTNLGYSGTGSDRALSFEKYGKRISGPQVGAIAVMRRGKSGGHVGVVSGFDQKGNPVVISGNYGKRVAEATIPLGRIHAYVIPN